MATSFAEGVTSNIVHEKVHLEVDDIALDVALLRRAEIPAPWVLPHGFGSTKEDFNDFVHHPSFKDHPFIAYDAPGCRESTSDDSSHNSIEFQVAAPEAILQHFEIEKFHPQGHSIGGLTALLLAHRNPSHILSFVNIEGSRAPEDCFLSRQIVLHPSDD